MTVERWTDEMLDSLASSLVQSRSETGDLKESVGELRESISEIRETVNGLVITSQALLQLAAQQQQKSRELEEKQAENDQRFNILLEEVRFLIRNQGKNPDNN